MTSVAIDNTIKGHALARAVGPANANISTVTQDPGYRPLVLMRNDGAIVSATSVPEVVFRFVAAVKNARVYSSMIATIGTASTNGATPYFLPGTATRTTDNYLRSWLYWMTQIESSMLADQARHPELWNITVETRLASSADTVSLVSQTFLTTTIVIATLSSLGLCL